MENFEKVPALVLLEDGTYFKGFSAGKIGIATGEVCFNTGMTGYQEIFTDPSYARQILVATNVHIGNYATKNDETESEKIQIAGFICRNFTNQFSRPKADQSIQDYFIEHNLVAVTNVDTRSLVRHIRDKGAMNIIISSESQDLDFLKNELAKVPSMEGLELASLVSTKEAYFLGDEKAKRKIAVMDYGSKKNILRNLAKRNAYLKVFPADANYQDVMDWQPDGILLSNGPGDPSAMPKQVEVVKQFLETDKPMFGICLGHQVLALANGLKTFKMHHGHRGSNHPVKNLQTGKCEITCQNHGFSIDPKSLENRKDLEITHINLNDNSIEGIKVKGKKAFSVQHHPESAPGPQDSRYLFDNFIELMN